MRKKWTAMEVPSWAKEALEKRARSYGREGGFHEFCRFTDEELQGQIDLERKRWSRCSGPQAMRATRGTGTEA